MGPELHHQMITYRVSDLLGQAQAHRLVREAEKGREGRARTAGRRHRFTFRFRVWRHSL
ncbi:hypothetical protein [Microtetraspora sp. NBRC 13810]|uniref:hypothetical protein n=1 Tax=Microtetraspora sp. NBRC 13810 TaxID=3030990 RepID=UPI0025556B00|nr:hypothetical protein [Microtetraspora sp. NBRC 13810]